MNVWLTTLSITVAVDLLVIKVSKFFSTRVIELKFKEKVRDST